MITRAAIVAEARTWTKPKTRWRHQAMVKGVGADCFGMLLGTALAMGIHGARECADDQTLHCYGNPPEPKALIAGCERFLVPIQIDEAGLADILVMAFKRDPQHFAMISRLDPMYVIHAYTAVRGCVENGVEIAGAKILRAYRFRGVA